MNQGEDDKCKVTVFSCQSVGRRRKCCGKLRGRRRRGGAGSVAIYRDEQNSKKDKGGTRGEGRRNKGEGGEGKGEEGRGRARARDKGAGSANKAKTVQSNRCAMDGFVGTMGNFLFILVISTFSTYFISRFPCFVHISMHKYVANCALYLQI